MANDDRILLNLVLNEATVSAVEGRVRNLVNRLNNQNVSVNINGQNFDSLINKANTLIQRMQTINATPLNINANLTSAQQQYRLETERMRVAQQLELSRQRTLQTENQAISALAQQNRTLNINNNVTHQIEQGAQNIGNNMNVAGGHARDFVDYLADGVRYLVTYRSIYAVMNQIGEAFSEMKNVDTAAIQVRKTTGMSKDEIEAIKKASYGVATEYGRSASEYLESVSEFARAGYKQHSTELGKLSLLTQNVGDVSAESADKMLLSVDAAYQLKGNVAELTNVVNALNNIANKNPTSMQKMADGLQVSASMAKTAGMDISELTALIGTGTAVTQREGAEVARAIRTIVMNVKSVKGELEDGTIIDDDSIAKAEAALKGVGISTKEVVNGVRELRNPMEVLDELADKWRTLGSEAKSVLTESIANKRQANVLSGILDNWSMVEKMQSEYFNSANSAIEENILYLEGWEAKSKVVSAKWTEYISNLADTKVITGTLDALYGLLSALDTPIGRIATSIVLVNTALAVSNRLWQQVRARSIVADILSMGVAERNLGEAIQLVSGHLGRQALAWATSPLGAATIAVAGITLITSAVEKNSKKLEENAQNAGEAYDKVKSNMNELDGFIKQYNDLQISNEWDNTPVETKKQLHEDINKLLGDEADKIDVLNGKYKETTEELFKQRMAKLPEEEKTAFDNEQAKGKTLWDTVYWNGVGGAGGYNYGTMQATDAEKKYIEKYDNVFDEKYYSAGGGMGGTDYIVRFDNFNDFIMKYEEVKKMLQELYNDGMGESDLYKGLNDFIAKFDTKVGDYKTAVEELENTKAGQKLGNYITQNVGGYIDNLEEYNKVVEWVKSNLAGEDKNSALTFLNSYFSEYADKVAETSDLLSGDYSSAIKSVSATLSTLQDKYDELKSAQEEYNSTGAISAETMQKLIDNDLLQYLDYSSGKLRINTDALLAEGEAAKVNAIQKLQDAMATDLMNLATGKTDQLSNTAKTAIANLGSAAETTGNKAQTAASKLAGFAIAAQAAKDGAEGNLTGMSVEEFNTQANAIISAYTSAANSIGGITIKSPKTSRSKGSSSDKNEALENHLKYIESIYKVHQDEAKYINDLQWAYNNLTKTDEERLEIAEKIEQARRDYTENRIKDLEHENELLEQVGGTEEQRIANLQEMQRIREGDANRYRGWMREQLLGMGYTDEDEISRLIESSDFVQEMQKGWWSDQDKILDIYDTLANTMVDDINHQIELNINNHGEDFNNNAYYKQIQEIAHAEAERLRALDPEKYKEQIQEWQNVWWDAEKAMLDFNKKIVDDFLNQLNEKLDDTYDIQIKRLNSRSSLLSAHYGVLNAINEEQHNLNKELLEAETIGARMNEQERETLFTKQEHTRLSGKLNDIMLDITDLQSDYQHDLSTATEDTIEEITNNYERQYELKMKEYEIVRAELDLMRKRQILENVENEKSVRTWNGSEWVYEANLQDVLDAQEELANAEYELAKAKTEEAQQLAIDALDIEADALQTEKNKFATAIDEMAEKMDGSGKRITDMLKTIAETDLPTFDAIIQDLGGSLKEAFGITDEDINKYRTSSMAGRGGSSGLSSEYVSWAKSQMEANGKAWHSADADGKVALEKTNQSLGAIIGSTYDEVSGTWKHKYATGTKNAHKGLGLFDENGLGSEFILTKDGVLTQFQGGEHVFSPEMADRLWEMAQQNYNFAPVISQSDFGKLTPIEERINNAINNAVTNNAFGDTYYNTIKDLHVNDPDEAFKGFVNYLKKTV